MLLSWFNKHIICSIPHIIYDIILYDPPRTFIYSSLILIKIKHSSWDPTRFWVFFSIKLPYTYGMGAVSKSVKFHNMVEIWHNSEGFEAKFLSKMRKSVKQKSRGCSPFRLEISKVLFLNYRKCNPFIKGLKKFLFIIYRNIFLNTQCFCKLFLLQTLYTSNIALYIIIQFVLVTVLSSTKKSNKMRGKGQRNLFGFKFRWKFLNCDFRLYFHIWMSIYRRLR